LHSSLGLRARPSEDGNTSRSALRIRAAEWSSPALRDGTTFTSLHTTRRVRRCAHRNEGWFPEMAAMHERLRQLSEQRLQIWHQCQELLDRPVAEKRSMTAEENQQYERMSADLDRYDRDMHDLRTSTGVETEISTLNDEAARVRGYAYVNERTAR